MDANPTDRFININGLNIHYLDWGGSSPRNLLLVHGQGGNAHNWDFIARELRHEFRIIAIDQRGHGDSSHTREGYAVTAFAADLAAFANAIDIVPYDYVGASLGARNAIPYAGDHPAHLKHLVCLDYGPEMSVASARNQISGMNRRPLGWRSIDEYVEHSAQANPRPSAEYHRNSARYGLRLNYAGKYIPKHDPDMFWINGSFGKREVPLLWQKWANIRCPVLIIKGADSDFLSPDILARMKAAQPRMQFVEAPDSGHPIAADNPAFLLAQLRRFFID